MNYFRQVLILLACMAALACGIPSQAVGESKLLQAMRSTSDLQQSNPSRSLECFQYYSGVFDQLLQQYEQDFQNCQNASELQKSQLDDSFKPVIGGLGSNAVSACQLIDSCNNQVDSLHSLACFSAAGSDDAKVMYNISVTANMYYGQLQQRIQLIQFTEEQCTNTSKLNYELKTDQAYVNLQSCLMGNEPLPTTTSTTSTTAATPIETTNVIETTKAPETSLATESSTEASSEPLTTTSSLIEVTPTASASAAPNLRSDLKKFLNSLKH